VHGIEIVKSMRKDDEMSGKKFMVFIIQYQKKDEKTIENFVEEIAEPINASYGEIKRIYQGSEEKIMSALESIMNLTK
jgi:hypothetical protein